MIEEKMSYEELEKEFDRMKTARDSLLLKVATLRAQRTWVGLTHEEIEEVWEQVESSDFLDCVHPLARAIEAKLKEKNT